MNRWRHPSFVLVVMVVLATCFRGASAQSKTAPNTQRLATVTLEKCLAQDFDSVFQKKPGLSWDWSVHGIFLDSKENLIKFLSPLLADAKNWSQDNQCDIVLALLDIGYYSDLINERKADGRLKTVIRVEPVTSVRHVEVDTHSWIVDRLLQPLFADDIIRRLQIRPGMRLPRKREDVIGIEEEEEIRIANYLQGDGFYDAEVDICITRLNEYTADVRVNVTPGDPYSLGKIEALGNTALSEEEIRDFFEHERICIFGLCAGSKRFSKALFNDDIDRLAEKYKESGFPGVRVRKISQVFNRAKKTVDTVLEIRERKKVDIIFVGNDHYSPEGLLKRTTLAKEGSYDDVEIQLSADALKSYYQSKGYFEANISWKKVKARNLKVVFTIDEGPKLRVRRINFNGNVSLNDDRLKNTIKTQVYKDFIIGESGGYATNLQLQNDINRITAEYQALGFISPSIEVDVHRHLSDNISAPRLAASIAGGVKTGGLYIDFHIKEGTFVEVQKVEVTDKDSNPLQMSTEILNSISLTPGKRFLAGQVEKDTTIVANHFLNLGFPRSEVETSVCYLNSSDKCEESPKGASSKAFITHKVKKSTQAQLGAVIIRGNFKTRRWVIEETMGLKENELWTEVRKSTAQSNLRRSGLFSNVKIAYQGLKKPEVDKVNVVVNVTERHDYVVQGDFGGGFSTDSKLFVEGRGENKNLLGTGISTGISTVWGQERKQLLANFRLPQWVIHKYFLGSFTLDLNLTWRSDLTPRFGTLRTLGGSVVLSKAWRTGTFRNWEFQFRYDYRDRNRDVDFLRQAGNSLSITQNPVDTISSEIGPQLTIDRRSDFDGSFNPVAPSKGYFLLLRASYAEDVLLGKNTFVKLAAAGQYFIPIGRKITISNGLRYDQGFALNGSLLPEVERFFSGGDTTVRGYEEDQMEKEIIESEFFPLNRQTSRFRILPAGGNLRMIHNFDLQVKIVTLGPFELASALFIDSGLVTNQFRRDSIKRLKHSLGISMVRLAVPFGSLSAEWAFPLNPTLGDNPLGRFHFNVGILF